MPLQNLPIIMAKKKNAVLIQTLSKIFLHPPPARSICPPLTNPGYTTVIGVIGYKGVQGPSPPPPLIGGERLNKN